MGDERMIDTDTVREVLEAYWEMQSQIYEGGMDLSDFTEEDKVAWVTEILRGEEE